MLKPLSCVLALLCCVSAIAQEAPPAAAEGTDAPVADFAALTKFLDRQQVQYDVDHEAQYVAIPTKQGPIDSVMVIRWAASDGVIHFVQIMPFELPPEKLAAVESTIVRMNHAYPVPGLGMNHDANAVYFRFTIPLLPRGFVNESEVSEFFSYTISQAAALHPTIDAVIQGTVQPEGALAFHNANVSRPSGPYGTWKRELVGSVWVLQINDDGTVQLKRDDAVVVNSKATIADNKITFNDENGPLATNTPGEYQFTLADDGTMTFEVLNDTSKGRRQVLTGEPWTR